MRVNKEEEIAEIHKELKKITEELKVRDKGYRKKAEDEEAARVKAF